MPEIDWDAVDEYYETPGSVERISPAIVPNGELSEEDLDRILSELGGDVNPSPACGS